MTRDPRYGLARLGRLWLVVVVALVPVQLPLIRWAGTVRWVPWLDEISVVGLSIVAAILRATRRGRRLDGEMWLAGALAIFVGVCVVSALARQTGALAFALGSFDYVKSLGFLWCAAVLADDTTVRRLLFVIRTLAIVAALWALAEMASGWFLAHELSPLRFRFGVYRPDGPMGHPNLLGLFLLLATIVELTVGTRRKGLAALFYSGMVATLSRIVHAAAVVSLAPLVRRTPILALAVAGSAAISVASVSMTEDELAVPQGETVSADGEESYASYRSFAVAQGLRVWREHPLLGAGPGRFGGVVSHQLGSPVYERHPFPSHWKPLFDEFRSLDVFYPQLLAELGIVGALAFVGLGLALFVVLVRRWRAAVGNQREWAGAGLLCLLVVPIYCLGAGLNLSAFLIPAMVVIGVALGVEGAGEADARIG